MARAVVRRVLGPLGASNMSHEPHIHEEPPATEPPPHAEPEPLSDPACGMRVVPGRAHGGSAIHLGHEYWFCSPRCREKFVADPAVYVGPVPHRSTEREPVAPAATEWVCPMHPQIVRDAPGTCPICGMAL